MSSKRHIRARKCTGKVRYANVDLAFAALKSMQARYDEPRPMEPYRCRFCKQFHVGPTDPRNTMK